MILRNQLNKWSLMYVAAMKIYMVKYIESFDTIVSSVLPHYQYFIELNRIRMYWAWKTT